MDKKNLLSILIAIVISQPLVFLLQKFEIGSVFIILGFRFYLPFLVAGIVVLFMNRQAFVESFRLLQWLRPVIIVFVLLLIGGAVYLIQIPGMWLKNDPENLFELGISSIFDFPIYTIWNFPQFLFIYALLGNRKKLTQIPISFFAIILLCGADLYSILATMNTIPQWIFAVIGAAVTLSIYLYKASNAVEFGTWTYTALWMPLLLFGSQSQNLISILFARNFTEWEGLLKVKSPSPAVLIGGLLLVAVFPVIFLKQKK